jgi:alkylated DNA repair protein (DNA oxidative demethylase)
MAEKGTKDQGIGATGLDGAKLYPGLLSRAAQGQMLAEVLDVIAAAPLFRPEMPRTGKPFSVEMTNAGPLGWVSDRAGGYRYQDTHPVTGKPWPAIPQSLLGLWHFVAGYTAPPECCLVNYYAPGAKMGLHQDKDEQAMDAPVVSVSLGDRALFKVKGPERSGPASWSVKLTSGDVVVLGGKARDYFHGIDRIYPGTSTLLPQDTFPEGGRINLTLRRVTSP